MEFTTLTRRVAEIYDVDPAAIEPDPRLAARRRGAIGAGAATRLPFFGETPPRRRRGRPCAGRPARRPRPTPRDRPRRAGRRSPRRAPREARRRRSTRAPTRPSRSLERLTAWIARGRRSRASSRSTPRRASLDAMQRRPRRLLAGARARQAPATCRCSTGGDADLFGGGPRAGPDPRQRRARAAEAAAGGPGRSQDRRRTSNTIGWCSSAHGIEVRPSTTPC